MHIREDGYTELALHPRAAQTERDRRRFVRKECGDGGAGEQQAAEKILAAGGERILLTERGTTFGYGDLVVDMRGLVIMRELGWPVLYDATHSLQRPAGAETGGDRRFAFPLMRAAVACGVDGLFFETHPDPDRALSDPATQLPLTRAAAFLDEAVRVHESIQEAPTGVRRP